MASKCTLRIELAACISYLTRTTSIVNTVTLYKGAIANESDECSKTAWGPARYITQLEYVPGYRNNANSGRMADDEQPDGLDANYEFSNHRLSDNGDRRSV